MIVSRTLRLAPVAEANTEALEPGRFEGFFCDLRNGGTGGI